MEQLAGGEDHPAPAQAWEVVLDLVALDDNALRDHVPEQEAQFRDIPLPGLKSDCPIVSSRLTLKVSKKDRLALRTQ
jgi:hypothetical protein